MNAANISTASRQAGVFIVEALVSVLIFMAGIIALVGIATQSINQVSQTKYRNDASYLASELLGEMWITAGSPSTFNAAAWQSRVAAELPNGAATVTVNGTQVALDISWSDAKAGGVTHHYQTTAQIAKND
jgi:type IV pilus assembly protein PilV